MDDERINARYKEEWRDPEKRFREYWDTYKDKIEGLSPEARAETEAKIRERYSQYEKDEAELEEKEPDFYNRSTQGKHTSLVEFLLHDTNIQIRNAHEAQSARDAQKTHDDKLRESIEDRARQRAGRETDREREC